MQPTPMGARTARRGATYREQAGWALPARYGDPVAECGAAHQGAVLRDVSPWARLELSGRDHLDFLHRTTTASCRDLPVGAGVTAVFPDQRGRIVAVAAVYRAAGSSLVYLDPSSRDRILSWLDRYLFTEEVSVSDLTATTAALELHGPDAASLVRRALGCDLAGVGEGHLLLGAAPAGTWLARADAGQPGLRVIGPTAWVGALWDELEGCGAQPLGEEAWEVVRIEQGQPAAGREITDERNPWEVGLGHAVHPQKGCYTGQEVIARLQAYDKVKRRLVGLRWPAGPLPEPGAPLRLGGREVGHVTSACRSEHLGANLALALLGRAAWAPGVPLALVTDQGAQPVEVSPLPFTADAKEPPAV